jgi:hypothetical protein
MVEDKQDKEDVSSTQSRRCAHNCAQGNASVKTPIDIHAIVAYHAPSNVWLYLARQSVEAFAMIGEMEGTGWK